MAVLTRIEILESKIFNRLRNKTQLYSAVSDDHFHTRMLHTLQVKEYALIISKRIKKKNPKIKLDDNIISTSALLHDIGHLLYD